MPAAAIITGQIQPYRAATLPHRTALPDRPHDPASLADLLAWAAGCVWPEGTQSIPYAVGDRSDWTYSVAADSWLEGFAPGESVNQWPPLQASHDQYAQAVSIYLLGRLAEASITVEAPQLDSPGICYVVFPIYSGGYAVHLQSWERLQILTEGREGFVPDSSDLWRWSAARKDGGPQAATVAERNLPGALETAQAMADALFCVLPTSTGSRPRLGKW